MTKMPNMSKSHIINTSICQFVGEGCSANAFKKVPHNPRRGNVLK